MSDIEVSRVIAATPEALYDIVSDLPRMGELSPENKGGMWVKGATGPEVGARFRGTNGTDKRHWATTAVVEQADRGKVFAFRVEVGPVTGWRWLRDLGFTLQVPRPSHPKSATPAARRAWKKTCGGG